MPMENPPMMSTMVVMSGTTMMVPMAAPTMMPGEPMDMTSAMATPVVAGASSMKPAAGGMSTQAAAAGGNTVQGNNVLSAAGGRVVAWGWVGAVVAGTVKMLELPIEAVMKSHPPVARRDMSPVYSNVFTLARRDVCADGGTCDAGLCCGNDGYCYSPSSVYCVGGGSYYSTTSRFTLPIYYIFLIVFVIVCIVGGIAVRCWIYNSRNKTNAQRMAAIQQQQQQQQQPVYAANQMPAYPVTAAPAPGQDPKAFYAQPYVPPQPTYATQPTYAQPNYATQPPQAFQSPQASQYQTYQAAEPSPRP
ncbi:hypothetical protein HK101_007820 [Irineochytrium annulatum]|nr:hypothetical protein HK101_007820 [Irineochytrium annulatum]